MQRHVRFQKPSARLALLTTLSVLGTAGCLLLLHAPGILFLVPLIGISILLSHLSGRSITPIRTPIRQRETTLRIVNAEAVIRSLGRSTHQAVNDRATTGPFRGRSILPISGPLPFRQSVKRILKELETHAPHRYRQVLGFLPKAEYTTRHSDFAGRSDGLFTIDGSGDNSTQRNTYEWFRFVFLHEVGHNVKGEQENDWSEDAANAYAHRVTSELNHANMQATKEDILAACAATNASKERGEEKKAQRRAS